MRSWTRNVAIGWHTLPIDRFQRKPNRIIAKANRKPRRSRRGRRTNRREKKKTLCENNSHRVNLWIERKKIPKYIYFPVEVEFDTFRYWFLRWLRVASSIHTFVDTPNPLKYTALYNIKQAHLSALSHSLSLLKERKKVVGIFRFALDRNGTHYVHKRFAKFVRHRIKFVVNSHLSRRTWITCCWVCGN